MNTTKHIYTMVLTTALGCGVAFNVQAESSREGEALNKATVSLSQASQLAEKQEQGKTIGAEFDIEKGRPLWEVKTLSKTGVKEYKIDAATGAVIKIEDEHIRGKLTNFITGMNLKDLESAKTTLSQAISVVEKNTNGKAVKVEVEHERGGIQFDVFVRVGDKIKRIMIDAATGQAL
jgi:uncharacterized membrane protein YkoI